jgi:hypothetical protein
MSTYISLEPSPKYLEIVAREFYGAIIAEIVARIYCSVAVGSASRLPRRFAKLIVYVLAVSTKVFEIMAREFCAAIIAGIVARIYCSGRSRLRPDLRGTCLSASRN